jgi:4-amino-4-deoxy-L-arabinose transferase-like glycosyltransferase
MFHALCGRAGHYLLLVCVWAGLCLVNLGGPSLWDIDEGNNAEAAREMYESGDWVKPTFNGLLRVDKPALLYWLQMAGYRFFGVNEFSARLPSALAALLSVLLVYELGRMMFGAGAGLFAGLILASTVLFSAAAHFANPDALLNACGLLTFCFFWRDYERGGTSWLVLGGVATGLGMLAKGPVGLVLPSAVTALFLFWCGQSRRWFHPRLLGGVLAFILVAVPWYAWVGAETKAEFLRGFFLQHNVHRFLEPMENHQGSVLYYLLVLLVGFAPWSAFFAGTGWHIWSVARHKVPGSEDSTPEGPGSEDSTRAFNPRIKAPVESSEPGSSEPGTSGSTRDRYRFLACWIAIYLVFFSISRTKLPNYVLPAYPPLAILMAHFLDRWRRGELSPPAWTLHAGMAALCLIGLLTTTGLLVGGGALQPGWLRGRHLSGVEFWAFLGIVPLAGGLAGWWCLLRQRRGGVAVAVILSAVAFTGTFAAAADTIDRHKAPRALAQTLHANQPGGDIIVGCYQYFQPSLVFYCRQEVRQWAVEQQVLDTLQYPTPVYLFMPAQTWQALKPKIPGPHRELGRHRDLYRGCDIVLVTNR